MTGNELIDRLDGYMEEFGEMMGNDKQFPDWKELRRLALIGHAAETAQVVGWRYSQIGKHPPKVVDYDPTYTGLPCDPLIIRPEGNAK